jgi:hypothetical protein
VRQRERVDELVGRCDELAADRRRRRRPADRQDDIEHFVDVDELGRGGELIGHRVLSIRGAVKERGTKCQVGRRTGVSGFGAVGGGRSLGV